MSKKVPLTNQERRRCAWFTVALVLGSLLALAVAVNSAFQYRRFLEFQERAHALGRIGPSAAPLQNNLIINGTAAFVLLGCMLFIGARLRYHLRGRRWEQQLALARSVQAALIPSAGAGGEHCAVAAEFAPALELGGDLYDVFEAEDGKIAFAVGDVAGKGLPAAMLMGLLHGALRTNPWYRGAAAQEEFAGRLNAQLCGRTADARFASLFWGCYDPGAGTLHYISAGHCPGFLVRAAADGHAADAEITRLDSSGPVLGLLEGSRYRQMEAEFAPGDLLVLYSDGIVEAANTLGEEFGEERLCAALARCAGATAVEARGEILRAYRRFLGDAQADDDVTLLVLEARSPASAVRQEAAEMVAA